MNTYYYMDLMFDFHDVFLFDFMRCESSQSCPWYLYILDGSSENAALAWRKTVLFRREKNDLSYSRSNRMPYKDQITDMNS